MAHLPLNLFLIVHSELMALS